MSTFKFNPMQVDGDGAFSITSAAIVAGEIATGAVDTAEILDGAVVNADVGAAAAIAWSKMAALTDAQILVGNGSNVAVDVAVSGDVSMANTGAVTVTGSTGAFSVGTTLTTGSTTTSSGAGAVAITGMIHEVTTTGTGDALTLADGAEGQHLYVVYVAEGAGGDTAVLTPTNLAGANTTVTFTDLGDAAHLIFTAGAWYFAGGEAAVA